jgi:hypothetical protein
LWPPLQLISILITIPYKKYHIDNLPVPRTNTQSVCANMIGTLEKKIYVSNLLDNKRTLHSNTAILSRRKLRDDTKNKKPTASQCCCTINTSKKVKCLDTQNVHISRKLVLTTTIILLPNKYCLNDDTNLLLSSSHYWLMVLTGAGIELLKIWWSKWFFACELSQLIKSGRQMIERGAK